MLAEPSVKLVVRQAGVAPEELLADVVDLDVAGCQPTISGAPFVEVADAGVTKASGLERLCGILGVQQHEVTFGDHSTTSICCSGLPRRRHGQRTR